MAQQAELTKIAEGREAEIYAWPGGSVLRLLRNPHARQQAEREAAAMAALRSSHGPVPAVHGLTTVWDRPGIILERLEGFDLLGRLLQRPWGAFAIGRTMAEVQAQLHAATAPESLLVLKDRLRGRIATSSRVPERLREPVLALLAGLPEGRSICHGDFHPGNILLTTTGPVVIDWPNATSGDPLGDVARTLLLLQFGQPPTNTGLLWHVFGAVARRLLLHAYLHTYHRLRPIDPRLLRQWKIVLAAERLSEAIEAEAAPLTRLIERALIHSR